MTANDDNQVSLEEVNAAIERLTAAELLRLRRFAGYRMKAVGHLARGRDWEDLLSEALVATLSGRRTWRAGTVDFPYHLRQTMRSISDSWKRRKDTGEVSEADLHSGEPEKEIRNEWDSMEEKLRLEQALDKLRESVAADPVASEVLAGMSEGLTGPEIKELLEISEVALQSARRKISRKAQALEALFGPSSTD